MILEEQGIWKKIKRKNWSRQALFYSECQKVLRGALQNFSDFNCSKTFTFDGKPFEPVSIEKHIGKSQRNNLVGNIFFGG